jgi:hypothetical protein
LLMCVSSCLRLCNPIYLTSVVDGSLPLSLFLFSISFISYFIFICEVLSSRLSSSYSSRPSLHLPRTPRTPVATPIQILRAFSARAAYPPLRLCSSVHRTYPQPQTVYLTLYLHRDVYICFANDLCVWLFSFLYKIHRLRASLAQNLFDNSYSDTSSHLADLWTPSLYLELCSNVPHEAPPTKRAYKHSCEMVGIQFRHIHFRCLATANS